MSRSALANLKSWHLKYWAFLTGLPSTGTKTEMQALLLKNTSRGLPDGLHSRKIVSVDMGIRNLAFCAIELPSSSTRKRKNAYKVSTWTRMDLISKATLDPEALLDEDGSSTTDAQGTGKGRSNKRKKTPVDTSAFTPASLSATAYIVTQNLLSLRPDTILIERQRFRSGGAAAIQEWTVRVNMLESMLWACLETLRAQHTLPGAFPRVYPVNPARVSKFWVPGEELDLRPPSNLFSRTTALWNGTLTRKKVEKKDKVAVVRSWVKGTSDVDLEFVGDAAHIAEAFRLDKAGKSSALIAGGKLDDLADCLLQAVAWARWEENRQRLEEMWSEAESEA